MPRISTDNYDTVASWNGSQDLFIVEQPDGTKVATPAMVKQFMEAGDFAATGEIEDGHGNILKDMAKSADVNTALAGKQDTLTFDNVPTQNSNNPVKSGGIFSTISTKTGTITLNSGWSFQGGSNSCVKKVGDIAWLSAYIQNENSLTVNTVYQVGTLQEGFRPQKTHSFPIFLKDQSAIRGIVTIENSGIIYFRSLDGSKWILFTTIIFPLT